MRAACSDDDIDNDDGDDDEHITKMCEREWERSERETRTHVHTCIGKQRWSNSRMTKIKVKFEILKPKTSDQGIDRMERKKIVNKQIYQK